MTGSKSEVTSGGGAGTNGAAPSALRLVLLGALVLFSVLQTVAGALSRISDLSRDGQGVDVWRVAMNEATSLAAWFVCMTAIWWLVARLRPPRFGWPAALALHALATVPISLFHVGLMIALREAAYALAGRVYSLAESVSGVLLYEYRKDAPTYILLALTMAAIQWFTREQETRGEPPVPEVLEVSDGAVRHRVPIAEIDWAEAAGNYVTLHWRGRALLHRITLAALAETLAPHGFARIHRGRIVRRGEVRRIETGQSGDFTVTLADGTELRGSRRYRDRLAAN